ncbi:MAG: aldehyde dehydrogenase family protein [Planctomycetota bacterium]
MDVQAVDPATGRVLGTWPASRPADTDAALDAAVTAQAEWGARTPEARAAVLARAGELLRTRAPALTLLLADEVGRPVREGRAELDAAVALLDYLARHAARHLAPERVSAEKPRAYARFDPRGVLLAVLEGVTVYEDLAHAVGLPLATGSGVMVLPEVRAPASALAFVQVLEAAGVPHGLIGVARLAPTEATAWVADPRIAGAVARASAATVRFVREASARHDTEAWTEGPTNDALVVLADADVGDAVAAYVRGRFHATGQGRRGPRRCIVVEPLAERFERELAARIAALVVGPPRDTGTTIGPVLANGVIERLATHVEASVAAGARRVCASRFPEGPGAWCPALLVAGLEPGMPLFDERVQGPLALLATAHDEAHAFELATSSPDAVGLSVFGRDASRAEELALATQAAPVAVNEVPGADPRLVAPPLLRTLSVRRHVEIA